jgi:hypothetical protein
MLLMGVLALAACDEAGPYGSHALYRLTAEHVPTTAPSHGYDLDINGDGVPDSQLTVALAFLMRYGFGDVQTATDQAVAAGAVELVVDIQRDGRGDVLVNTFGGSADAYDPSSPSQEPLHGTSDGPFIKASGGDLPAVIAPFGIATPVVLHHAHVEMFAGPDSLEAIVDGAIDPEIVSGTLMIQWHDVVQAIVERDCSGLTPDCNCLADTPGASALGYFDRDHDCTVSLYELVTGPFVEGSVEPDLMFDGEPMMSFGFGLDAVRVP